ncbi:MAG TPA: response regulator [Ktedonobacterales bacterium]|nr:response regulator [Ktedonobacterales bacterium]
MGRSNRLAKRLADRSNMTAIDQRPILVVDDDDTIAMTLESFLVEEGYMVMVAHNGKEALQRAEESSPAVILLDMKMPIMDGWAFASAYRQQSGPHAPIIVMTAAHDSRQRASEIAADGFIPKPFDLDELLAVIRRYIPE